VFANLGLLIAERLSAKEFLGYTKDCHAFIKKDKSRIKTYKNRISIKKGSLLDIKSNA
jgi:hypothetical protein